MPTLTIPDFPDEVYDRLRMRAAANRRSIEEEARELLTAALARSDAPVEETLRRLRETIANLPDAKRDDIAVDSFLAKRRKVGEE